MGNDLPYYIRIVAALGPLLIGLYVAYVAWRQWRTARDKIILDIFDKRFAVFMDVRRLASIYLQMTEIPENEASLPNEIVAKGRFLFGEDVNIILNEIYQLSYQAQHDYNARRKITEKLNEFVEVAEAYMLIDAKRNRSWAEWFNEIVSATLKLRCRKRQ
ncbi:hypothetical protein ACI50E_00715 [Brucella sp. ZJ1_1]|uniref:DUF4760 domain-containing protein n=2 Tax=Brucella intermedia TaxID=94625 RepID=U4V6G4_9HYPH|nr:hypothetical protein [Brucella intermedia]ERM01580.1 hypothetical protein Q644_03090 [Brucella intermedia 229E]ELT50156.1 hypothetical protein D584_06065 [Brucella intermedia M86]MCB4919221.1 hypothetical protein [Brucella intermedia]NKB95436.1 hypothetical protein [Brucella intermedia]OOC60361.1 hypothetical protein AS855_17585 [Brucella intermedia M86]